MKFNKTTVIATAVAALFLTGSISISAATTHSKLVKCAGVNRCKSQSACKGANNACKAQNTCKGQGIKMMTPKQCKKKGGTIVQ